MNRRVVIALVAAVLSALAVAAVLFVVMSRRPPSVPAGELHSEAVSTAVNEAALTLFPPAEPAAPPPPSADGVGAFDPDTATWHLRTRTGDPAVFSFGDPGSVPLVGDWDGDGVDTVGTYDPKSATVTLRNTNSAGTADVTYPLGRKGDTAIAGDFDGDGVDTVSLFRATDGSVSIYNASGPNVGEPVTVFTISDTDGHIFAADFDGDGTDTIGSWDPATGTVTVHTTDGTPESQFTFETAGDRIFAGDWIGDGTDTPGIFASTAATVHLRYENTNGGADESYPWGEASWIPVGGDFGDLTSNVTVSLEGAPPGLAWAVESLYLELDAAPYYQGAIDEDATPMDATGQLAVEGVATTSEAFGAQVAVVTTDTDMILAVSDDGWAWSVVGGALSAQDFSATATDPRFVLLIGSDWSANSDGTYPPSPLSTYADSLHIYAVSLAEKEGAIVGIPRDTVMGYDGPGNVDGKQKVNRTMRGTGPEVITKVIADETSLPIEGYILTGFGSRITGFPGFEDVVDAVSGIDFLVPYSVPNQCSADPGTPTAAEGDTHIDGVGALSFSRERKCIPTDDIGAPIRNGNVIRTLSQGLLMKAATVQVRDLGIMAMPGLLDIMDDYTTTDLSAADMLTLASTVYEIDPGPMPTLTASDITEYGYGAYNLNPGELPNVAVEGCTAIFDAANNDYAQWFVDGHYETFADLADGTLDQLPIFEYHSGHPDPTQSLGCPWVLPPE